MEGKGAIPGGRRAVAPVPAFRLRSLAGQRRPPYSKRDSHPGMDLGAHGMSEWKRLVAKQWGSTPTELHVGPPASAEQISILEREIGGTLPTELAEMYREFDGAGWKDGDWLDWVVVPIARIPQLSEDTRRWFKETHIEVASRYIAFLDHGNGDATGFLMSPSGTPEEGVFVFEHEAVEFQDTQDWRESSSSGTVRFVSASRTNHWPPQFPGKERASIRRGSSARSSSTTTSGSLSVLFGGRSEHHSSGGRRGNGHNSSGSYRLKPPPMPRSLSSAHLTIRFISSSAFA
jgi:hypothetical protein